MSGEIEPVKKGKKKANKGSFTKGDPRINTAGRPKGVKNKEDLRDRLFTIFNKLAKDKNGNPVLDEGQELTRLEAQALMALKNAKTAKDLQSIIEILFGKDSNDVSVDINIKAYKTVSPDDWDNAEDN
jgi:hypothetical protein